MKAMIIKTKITWTVKTQPQMITPTYEQYEANHCQERFYV